MPTQAPFIDATKPVQVCVWRACVAALGEMNISQPEGRVRVPPVAAGTVASPYVLLGDTRGSRSLGYMTKDRQPGEVAHTPKAWSTSYPQALDLRAAIVRHLTDASLRPDVEGFRVLEVTLNSFDVLTDTGEEPPMYGALCEIRFTVEALSEDQPAPS